jgi:hypothetical protein
MTLIPSVQYTKNGDFTLAFQVVGAGPPDLIYLLFESPNVVGNWFVPEHARFMERLASFSRLVITDRRGMGAPTASRRVVRRRSRNSSTTSWW